MRLSSFAMTPLFIAGAILFAQLSFAQSDLQPVPTTQGFLADAAGVLSADDRSRISSRLKKLNQEKGSQLGVVIVAQTDPESLEDFSQRVFTSWKLGRRGIDDGVLLVLAVNNNSRQLRIHVGYGLEGAIPDAIAKRILTEQVRPMLDKSGPAAAISVAVDALIARMSRETPADANATVPISPAKVKAKETPVTELAVSESLFRLGLSIFAQIPLCAIAAFLFKRRIPVRIKLLIGIVLGAALCVLYAWVAQNSWVMIAAVVWLIIPALVAWKNWDRLSDTAWQKPRNGIAAPGSRELSRKAMAWLLGSAAIVALVMALMLGGMRDVFSSIVGLFWLLMAVVSANVLTMAQPHRSGRSFLATSNDQSASTWSSSDSGSSSDSSSGDSGGGGDSGGAGSSA